MPKLQHADDAPVPTMGNIDGYGAQETYVPEHLHTSFGQLYQKVEADYKEAGAYSKNIHHALFESRDKGFPNIEEDTNKLCDMYVKLSNEIAVVSKVPLINISREFFQLRNKIEQIEQWISKVYESVSERPVADGEAASKEKILKLIDDRVPPPRLFFNDKNIKNPEIQGPVTMEMLDKVSAVLAPWMDKKVNLIGNFIIGGFGLRLPDTGPGVLTGAYLISPLDNKIAPYLTAIYNHYLSVNNLKWGEGKYQPPRGSTYDPTTIEDEKAASFSVKEFLDDMRASIDK